MAAGAREASEAIVDGRLAAHAQWAWDSGGPVSGLALHRVYAAVGFRRHCDWQEPSSCGGCFTFYMTVKQPRSLASARAKCAARATRPFR